MDLIDVCSCRRSCLCAGSEHVDGDGATHVYPVLEFGDNTTFGWPSWGSAGDSASCGADNRIESCSCRRRRDGCVGNFSVAVGDSELACACGYVDRDDGCERCRNIQRSEDQWSDGFVHAVVFGDGLSDGNEQQFYVDCGCGVRVEGVDAADRWRVRWRGGGAACSDRGRCGRQCGDDSSGNCRDGVVVNRNDRRYLHVNYFVGCRNVHSSNIDRLDRSDESHADVHRIRFGFGDVVELQSHGGCCGGVVDPNAARRCHVNRCRVVDTACREGG